jgi:uncharacterized protein (TIGR02594 family)
MNIDRRSFQMLAGLAAIASLSPLGHLSSAAAQSKPTSDFGLGLLRPEDDPEFGHIIRGTTGVGGSVVGIERSRHEEVRIAVRLLFGAPRNASIIETARYFEQITEKNSEGELYSWEWAQRANPLIVSFFAMTGTAPATGDQIHWCAAFVSFCLYLANKPNKFTALSGGYRNYSTDATNNPRAGDVAVFSKRGEDGRRGFGHVGLFLRQEARQDRDGVILLGGNQGGATGSTGAVTEAWYPLESNKLFLHSIRRVQ